MEPLPQTHLRDPNAFPAAYRRLAPTAQAAAAAVLRDPDAAQDVVQDVFVLALDAPRDLPARARLADDLRADHGPQPRPRPPALARGRHRRRTAAMRTRRSSDPRSPSRCSDTVIRRHNSRAMLTALDGLPHGQRPAVLLHHVTGLTDRELAQATCVPLGTAKSRIRLGPPGPAPRSSPASPPSRAPSGLSHHLCVLFVRESSPRSPALEVAVSRALVERVDEGALGPVVRVYRPAPTLAFGRLDRLRPGFPAAAAAARAHGFEPVVRAPGGHAVAYHEGCVVVDEVLPHADPIAGLQERFRRSAETLAEALRELGVDSRVGRIAGEFCPGEYTVNARGAVKLVGSAQRVIRHASLLAASIAVTDAARLRAVLEDVYAALELGLNPATAGGVADETPAGVDDVERAVVDAYARRGELVAAQIDTVHAGPGARARAQARGGRTSTAPLRESDGVRGASGGACSLDGE